MSLYCESGERSREGEAFGGVTGGVPQLYRSPLPWRFSRATLRVCEPSSLHRDLFLKNQYRISAVHVSAGLNRVIRTRLEYIAHRESIARNTKSGETF